MADAHAASYTDYTSSDGTIFLSPCDHFSHDKTASNRFIDSQATLPDQGGNAACHSGAGGWQRNISLDEQKMVAMGTRSASSRLQKLSILPCSARLRAVQQAEIADYIHLLTHI